MKDQFNNLVGKILNIPNDQLADYYESDGTTLKADAIDRLVELDANRIKTIKDNHKTELTSTFDKGYNKAKGETLTSFENSLKQEFQLTTESKGIDLIKEVVAKHAKLEIDDEKVKLHPLFIGLENKLKNDFVPKSDFDKILNEFNDFKSNAERIKVTSVIKQDALKAFRELKPVLSSDATRAINQENDFLEKLAVYQYELSNDGKHIVKDKEGKRLETANGYAIDFADFVKAEASKYFDFAVQDPKGNSGNNNHNSNIVVTLPQTEEEYKRMLVNETDPKKQVALMEAWKAKYEK